MSGEGGFDVLGLGEEGFVVAEAAGELEGLGEFSAGDGDGDDGHAGVGPGEVHCGVAGGVEAFGCGAFGGGGEPEVDLGAVHVLVEALAEVDAALAAGFGLFVGELEAGEVEGGAFGAEHCAVAAVAVFVLERELAGGQVAVELVDVGDVGEGGGRPDVEAGGAKLVGGLLEGALGGFGGLFEVGAGGDADAGLGGFGVFALAPAGEESLGGEDGVVDGAGEEAEVVDGGGVHEDAVGGDAVEGGLEADDAAEGGGADYGADGLGAEREGGDACGDGGGGAAGGAAGGALEVVGVGGCAGCEVGEFGGDGFAEDERAGVAEASDGIGFGAGEGFGGDGGAGAGGHAVDVDDVLDQDDRAVERGAAGGIGVCVFEGAGFGVEAFAAARVWEDGADLGVGLIEAGEGFGDGVVERALAGAGAGDLLGEGDRGDQGGSGGAGRGSRVGCYRVSGCFAGGWGIGCGVGGARSQGLLCLAWSGRR